MIKIIKTDSAHYSIRCFCDICDQFIQYINYTRCKSCKRDLCTSCRYAINSDYKMYHISTGYFGAYCHECAEEEIDKQQINT